MYEAPRRACSKARIAEAVGCNVKTADRLMAGLRADGLLVVEPRWSENGGQLANSYRLPRCVEGER